MKTELPLAKRTKTAHASIHVHLVKAHASIHVRIVKGKKMKEHLFVKVGQIHDDTRNGNLKGKKFTKAGGILDMLV